jgi:hypothetical protein
MRLQFLYFFVKIPVMVRCIIAGLERGEGFAQFWNFSNFLGKTRPLHANPKIQLRKRRCAQNAFNQMRKHVSMRKYVDWMHQISETFLG